MTQITLTVLAAIMAYGVQASVVVSRESLARRAFDVANVVPKSYDSCVLDPYTMGHVEFRLYDTRSREIVQVNDHIGVSHDMGSDLAFKVSHPTGAKEGLNDFTAEVDGETSYMALFKDGTLGWTNRSSNGQTSKGGDFSTTIFALACNGRVYAGIDGGEELSFSLSDLDGTMSLVPATTGDNNNNNGMDSSSTPSTLVAVPDVPEPGTATDELRRSLAKRDNPRCPAGQVAVTKSPPALGVPNGCGAADMPDFVPDGIFLDCCNGHDTCYGTCSTTFDGCNDAFLSCLQRACNDEYGGFFKAPIRATCHAGARIYHGAVSAAGGGAFDGATEDNCDCV